jgi:hypothetical protein
MSRRAGGFARALAAASDDAACAALPLATVVTCLYYGLLFTNPRLVEEECARMRPRCDAGCCAAVAHTR